MIYSEAVIFNQLELRRIQMKLLEEYKKYLDNKAFISNSIHTLII